MFAISVYNIIEKCPEQQQLWGAAPPVPVRWNPDSMPMPVNLFTLYSMLFSYYCGFLCFVIVMNILNACCRCSACSSLCFYYLWDVHKMNLGENLSILLDNVLHTVFFDLLEMIFLARFGVCAFFCCCSFVMQQNVFLSRAYHVVVERARCANK